MRTELLLFFLLVITACNPSETTEAGAETVPLETTNPNVYETQAIPGSELVRAKRKAVNGSVMEEGFLKGGEKTGTWVIYHPNSVVPKQVISFVDGRYHGIYMEFNNRGYLELRAEYKDNILDGPWAKYRFGRPTFEATYVDGELDGLYREYIMNTGKLAKEISYKNGVIDGPYRFYNEEGQILLEYEYRNGEKVGGGEVDPNQPNAPR